MKPVSAKKKSQLKSNIKANAKPKKKVSKKKKVATRSNVKLVVNDSLTAKGIKAGNEAEMLRRAAELALHISILNMRQAGQSYHEIALYVNLPPKEIRSIVMNCMTELAEEFNESANLTRQLELIRCDEMMASIWEMVKMGNLKAQDQAIKIMNRRAKLMGLDSEELRVTSVNDGPEFTKDQLVAMAKAVLDDD